MRPILCSVLSLLCASVAISQTTSLAELEAQSRALASETNWSQEKSDRADALNFDLVKLIDSDVLKSASEFQRASAIVQFTRGALPEARMRYELTFIAATLGDETAAKNLAAHWDQFLLATGRPQHLGTMKSFQGTQAEKYKPQLTGVCVATVFLDPVKSREKASILAPNAKIRQLVEEDQKVRQTDWSKLTQAQIMAISKADDDRQKQLKSLLKEIKLMTAQDYHDAALIMQHGSWFNDYALAHELAICSMILDPKIGRQLVALTYDRMLESAGYLQRVATQYHGVTLSAVDSVGFSDEMRKALGRKPLAEVPKKFGG